MKQYLINLEWLLNFTGTAERSSEQRSLWLVALTIFQATCIMHRASPAIWNHSVTWYLTRVNAPNQRAYSIHLPLRDRRLSWTWYLVIYWTGLRLRSHKHEYESGTVWVPVYECRQTRVYVYFNGGRSHTYEYGLPVNFTYMSSFCAGHVFIQPMQSKLPVNSTNVIYKSCGAYLTSEMTSL